MNGLTRLGAAGIKEGLYDNEALAAYLLYRLNALNKSGMVITYPNSTTSLIVFPCPASLHLNPFGPKNPLIWHCFHREQRRPTTYTNF
jgi:hypothetical protein